MKAQRVQLKQIKNDRKTRLPLLEVNFLRSFFLVLKFRVKNIFEESVYEKNQLTTVTKKKLFDFNECQKQKSISFYFIFFSSIFLSKTFSS